MPPPPSLLCPITLSFLSPSLSSNIFLHLLHLFVQLYKHNVQEETHLDGCEMLKLSVWMLDDVLRL